VTSFIGALSKVLVRRGKLRPPSSGRFGNGSALFRVKPVERPDPFPPRRLPLSLPPAWPTNPRFPWHASRDRAAQGQLSRDAGLLPIRPFDQCIGLTPAFTDPFEDPATSFDTRKATVPIASAALFEFDFFEPLPIQIEVSEAPLNVRRRACCPSAVRTNASA